MSNFFSAMVTGGFKESQGSHGIPFTLVSEEIFQVIREFLYTFEMPSLSFDLFPDICEAADMLLIPGILPLTYSFGFTLMEMKFDHP